MQAYRTGKAQTVTLVGINLLLGVLIAMEIHFSLEPTGENLKVPVQPQAELILPPPRAISMPPFEHYAAIVQRPLFNYDRRPHDGAREDASDKVPSRLLGIVITSDSKEALFLTGPDKVVVHGLVGEEVDGWEIVSIQADSVILNRGEQTKEIKLERASPPLPPGVGKKSTR